MSTYGYQIMETEETCPQCGVANVSAVMKYDTSDGSWTDTNVRLCHNCGYVWVKQ